MKVFITDTHFGRSNNNYTVFDSQMRFLENQFEPWLEELREKYDEPITLVHCGDVFDNRSTIGIRIASEVQDWFLSLKEKVDKMVIIAGNHDYLTQTDSGRYNINSIDVILRPMFLNEKNIILNTQDDIYIDNHNVAYINFNNWTYENIEQAIHDGAKTLVAHTDLANMDPDIANLIKLKKIVCISGHIHIPDLKPNSYNLGSCFPLDFNDANGTRCAYCCNDDCTEMYDILNNTESDQFVRLYDDDVLNMDVEKYHKTDAFEAYIPKNDYIAGKYDSIIKYINTYFIRQHKIIPYDNELPENEKSVINFDEYDIGAIIEESIGKDYLEHFHKIKENIN